MNINRLRTRAKKLTLFHTERPDNVVVAVPLDRGGGGRREAE